MGQIKIGPKFFQGEIRVYRNVLSAFVRENLQNAVDSGATRVDINIDNLEENSSRFSIIDNGCGMTRDCLNNIYFILGETTKTESGSIGGYGKARILTSFSQNKYTLHTGNLITTGCGSDYDIVESDQIHNGVKLEIETIWSSNSLLQATKEYLSKCHICSCQIFINGERWTNWAYRRRIVRELSFGTVHTNKAQSPELLVRVNGTLMYTCWTNASAQVIVEIDPERSRSILQSSRDGLQGQCHNELASFINELNINRQSALRRKVCKSTRFQGTGTFTAKRKKDLLSTLMDNAISGITSIMPRLTFNNDTNTGVQQKAVNAHSAMNNRIEDTLNPGLNIFDIIIEDETENDAVRKRIDQYDPRNWDIDGSTHYNSFGSYRKGTGMYRQIVMWRTACEAIIELLQENFASAPDSISWGVGWLFSDTSQARWLSKNGVNYLMLNPCDESGKMKYSISAKEDLIKIVVLACHEVVHILQNNHDEDFASMFTELMQHVSINMSDILRRMKDAKETVRESVTI